MGPVTIFDSTLRDGAQGTGVAFSLEDKLQAVRLLEDVYKRQPLDPLQTNVGQVALGSMSP